MLSAAAHSLVKPSALHCSEPTPWWTKNSPSGSYFLLSPRVAGSCYPSTLLPSLLGSFTQGMRNLGTQGAQDERQEPPASHHQGPSESDDRPSRSATLSLIR
jgi:hypothetical protein